MIIKKAVREARVVLGNDFADVWYTFVRSFNRLKAPSQFVNPFNDDPDKVRKQTEDQFWGHFDSLLEQLKILQGFVSKKIKSEEGEVKDALLSLSAALSKAKNKFERFKEIKEEIEREGHKSDIRGEENFRSIKEVTMESHLLNARDNILLLASLKKEKK